MFLLNERNDLGERYDASLAKFRTMQDKTELLEMHMKEVIYTRPNEAGDPYAKKVQVILLVWRCVVIPIDKPKRPFYCFKLG